MKTIKMEGIRQKMARLREMERYFPPGYDYVGERASAVLLLGLGVVLSFQYFVRLAREVQVLRYLLEESSRVPRPEAVAKPFLELLQGHYVYYVPLLLFLLGMSVYHYIYYYRDTKSIYLMRRLPGRGVLWKSCVQGPLLGAGFGAAVIVLLYLLYYCVYLLAIPAECLPRLV